MELVDGHEAERELLDDRPGPGRGRSVPADRIEAFYRREHLKLWRSLLGYVGDPDLASEAESEALTQALSRGDEIDDPSAWIWRTSFRVAAGLLKARGQRARPMAEPPSPSVLDAPVADVVAMLHELPEQQRAIVALRHVAGLRPAEIADVLETTPGNVRVQLHHAHRTLRETWSDV